MPTWFILLLALGVALGLIYCLAMWDARRECRACRIGFYALAECAGGGLLHNGWSRDSDLQFHLGVAVLVILNLYLGLKLFVSHLKSKKQRGAARSHDETSVGLAAGAAALAATEVVPAASRETEPDEESPSRDDSADLDLDP